MQTAYIQTENEHVPQSVEYNFFTILIPRKNIWFQYCSTELMPKLKICNKIYGDAYSYFTYIKEWRDLK